MDYIYLGVGTVIGFHALTYAKWLKDNGNILGTIGLVILTITSLALPVLRIIKGN